MMKTTMNTILLVLTRPNSPVKIAKSSTDDTTPPMTCQGWKRPNRVVVLSTRLPSRGSRKISAILMTKTSTVMTPMSASASVLSYWAKRVCAA